MKSINLIKQYIKKSFMFFSFFVLISFFLSIINVIAPIITGTFLDNLLSKPSESTIINTTIIFVFIAVFQIGFSYISSILSVKLKSEISFYLIKDLVAHILHCKFKTSNSMNPAYTIQRIMNDSESVVTFVLSFLSGLVSNAIIFIFCFCYILINATLIAFILLCSFLIYFFLFKCMNPLIEKISTELKENAANFVSTLQEQIKKIKFIKIFNLYEFFSRKSKLSFRYYYNSNIKNTKINFIFFSSSTIINLFLQISLFIYGGYSIINGEMTIGIFTILSSYLNSSINSLKYFTNLIPQLVEGNVSANRIQYYFSLEKEKQGKKIIDDIYEIRLSHVYFSYDNNMVINDFSFCFEKGKIYQIIGNNGCGKTTLLSLIMGLYLTEYQGDIKYNQKGIQGLDMNVVREKCLSVVLQDDFIFDGTFDENINMEKFNSEDNTELQQLLLKYNLSSLYKKIKVNDNFLIKDALSGGEIKKLEIIRSLLKTESSLMILDEPTTSLDIQSKLELIKSLNENKSGKIIIVVSHESVFDDIIDEKIYL